MWVKSCSNLSAIDGDTGDIWNCGRNLIVTYDKKNGGLDFGYIDRLIKDTFDL